MDSIGLVPKVLVLVDADLQLYYSALLSRAGYDTTVTDDIREAAGLCERNQYRLILVVRDPSDLLVESFVRSLRRSAWYRSQPIAMAIHSHSMQTIEVCYDYGVDEIVCLPTQGAELLARLKAMLRRVESIEDAYAQRFAEMADSLMRRYDSMRQEMDVSITHKIYCEMIYSITDGHFILLDYDEFDDYVKNSESDRSSGQEYRFELSSLNDVDKAAVAIEKAFAAYHQSCPDGMSYDEDDVQGMCLCASELSANIMKHGGGSGEVRFNVSEKDARFYASDHGAGINEAFLANALFLGGGSSKASFGFGFSIIYELSDYIVMATGHQGTRIMVVKKRVSVPKQPISEEVLARF